MYARFIFDKRQISITDYIHILEYQMAFYKYLYVTSTCVKTHN